MLSGGRQKPARRRKLTTFDDDFFSHICDVKGVYGDEDVNAVFGWKGYAEFAAAQQK